MSKRKRAQADDPENTRPASSLRGDGVGSVGPSPMDTTFSSPSDNFGQLSSVTNFSALQAHNVAHGQSQQSVDGRTGGSVTTPSTTSASDTAAAALASHYQMSLPQSADSLFQPHTAHDSPTVHPGTQEIAFGFALDSKIEPGPGQDDGLAGQPMMVPTTPSMHASAVVTDNSPGLLQTPTSAHSTKEKPAVGTEAWHKLRRDNHKEVERRRRETINEGINELAKIVPGCEKNKGSILQRAVQYITQLKDNESQNVEKWTLEKLLTEQAISELSATVDDLKNKLNGAWGEIDRIKAVCDKAGVDLSGKDKSVSGR